MAKPASNRSCSSRSRRGRPRITKGPENHRRKQRFPTEDRLEGPVRDPPRRDWHWSQLPYQIQFEILLQVSFTLREEGRQSQSWLLSLAKTSSALARPSLAALYYAPKLTSNDQAQVFLEGLASEPPDSLRRMWVKYLSIEVYPTLMLGTNIKLEDLLPLLPNLRGLSLEAQGDQPHAKRSMIQIPERSRGPLMTANVIDAIKASGIVLRSFKWTYFFDRRQDWPWSSLTHIHQTTLRSIQHLDILWHNMFSTPLDRKSFSTELVGALNVLPKLQSLTFSFSTIDLDPDLLASLPLSLKRIAFIDCDIDYQALKVCLESVGTNLQSLILRHNQALDLNFLTLLDNACPNLQNLEFDLSCFANLTCSRSWALHFKSLFSTNLPLTWPKTLRHIEFKFLRGWGQEAAEKFLSSFQFAASQLQDLRVLILRMSVDMDWRERVAFRDKWSKRLELIYKRNCADPMSIQETNSQRHSKRRRTTRQMGMDETSLDSRPKQKELSTRSSTRSPKTRMITRGGQGNISHSCGLDATDEKDEDEGLLFIQGQCHIVDIVIDNLRPMESQFNEGDFLDSEKSGDEDWTGPGDDEF